MKLKLFLLFSLMQITTTVRSQTTENIVYILPDDVEVKLDEHISRFNKKELSDLVLTIEHDSIDCYRIYVNSISKIGFQHSWKEVTTRYVVVNQKYYPVLFDYDYNFSTPDPENIGSFGNREGNIKRSMLINEGFYIRFSKRGILPH